MYNPNFYAPLAVPMQYAKGGSVNHGLSAIAEQIRRQGRGGDTILAHINPEEAGILKALGGSGTINPQTGLPEFGFFKELKKAVSNPVKYVEKNVVRPIGGAIENVVETIAKNPLESAALIAAAYFAPQLLASIGTEAGAAGAAAAGGGAAELASVAAAEAAAANAGMAGLGALDVAPLVGSAAGTTAVSSIPGTAAGTTAALTPAATVAPATAAAVPNAFNAAVNTAVSGAPAAGGFGAVGTGGFGAAAPAAADVASGLTGAGISAGTAANLAGQTAAGTGAATGAGATAGLAGLGSSALDFAKSMVPTNLKEAKDAAQLASLGVTGYGMISAAQEQKAAREAAEKELAEQAAKKAQDIQNAQAVMAEYPSRYRRLTAEDVRKYGIGMPKGSGSPSYAYETLRAAGGGQIVPHDSEYGSDDSAAGGGLMALARGGALPPRFLSGGGDGMSDSIHANIEGRQEARLADGEFVIPADVVSGIGNGSSKAGAKKLYAMMDRVRQARTGRTKQAPAINARRLMPA